MRLSLLLAATALLAAQNHPQQISVNGKNYNWPKSPVVVILIDGGDPSYVNTGLSKGCSRISRSS